jgi:nicotinate dehydrogenase subunit B
MATASVPWSEEQLVEYMRTGFSNGHGVAAGPMGPVVSGLAMLPESDVRAIANYLISLPGEKLAAQRTPAKVNVSLRVADLAAGRRIFEGACLGCHSAAQGGPVLFGVSPSMAANTGVHSERPNNLIQVILQGIESPANGDLGYMPAFKASFSDTQVADLVAYLRAEFAPQKSAWPELTKQVAWLRANPGSH